MLVRSVSMLTPAFSNEGYIICISQAAAGFGAPLKISRLNAHFTAILVTNSWRNIAT